ncbi:MAG: hypothetical protein SCALA702_37260 [Melioribacteraceae bacterium]|nr:MAG: hypothetical protein SCALA702_37260 [Melioribacteraceae bacterium]
MKNIKNIKNKYDVIVTGAGIAGVSAAIKAGSMGASVLLIEHYGFVGGMSTAGMVSPFMNHKIDGKPLVNGVFSEIESGMRQNGGMIDNGFLADSFRSVVLELLAKNNVTVLLHSGVISVNKVENCINSLDIWHNNRVEKVEGKVFIDTSGDAHIVYLGDFPWVKGDEKSGHLQALTLFFRMGGIDMTKVADYARSHPEDFMEWMEFDFDFSKILSVAGYYSFIKRAHVEGKLPEEIEYIFFTTLPESGEGSFNTSNVLGLDGSTSFDLTRAELIGRNQVDAVVRLLQEDVPGFEKSYIVETAVQVGVRETRRAVGDYVVTGEDIKSGAKFDDAIARGCYGIDIHGQKGEKSRMEHLDSGVYYEIPLRALIVKDASNLMVAGRNISATREGHSALRIMPTSSAMGEACGAAAAIAAKKNSELRDVKYDEIKNNIIDNIQF